MGNRRQAQGSNLHSWARAAPFLAGDQGSFAHRPDWVVQGGRGEAGVA